LADYPGWIMKFKEKGTFINKVGDKYYLYAAYSQVFPQNWMRIILILPKEHNKNS